MELDEGQQSEDFGFGRHEFTEQIGKPFGIGGEIASLRLISRTGEVAFVEHQIEDGEDLVQPIVQLIGVWDAVWNASV